MKKIVVIALMLILIPGARTGFSLTLPGIGSGSTDIKKWISGHFAKGKVPPFSFVYGGKNSDSFIRKWGFRAEKLKPSDAGSEESLYTYTDQHTGLTVSCLVTSFIDFRLLSGS